MHASERGIDLIMNNCAQEKRNRHNLCIISQNEYYGTYESAYARKRQQDV